MDDGESATGVSDSDLWDRLLAEQTALFRKTSARNQELERRLEEAERELSVWKVGLKVAEEDKAVLRKEVKRLERNIGSLKDDNPLILCLIDGDGNIFSSNLITQGQAGGRDAAMLLTKGLIEHMSSLDPNPSPTAWGQLWSTIYCNKKGLTETLISNNVCTAEQFEEFIMGFCQAAPLFSFVDVGAGKEAADSKIKECLRVFTRFPQTSRVFFGGAHDNGYTSTLNYLQNEGLHSKLTILRGYEDLAHELKGLNLPHLNIEGLFMTKKLPTHAYKKPHMQDSETSRYRASPSKTRQAPDSPENLTYRKLVPNVPIHRQRPPPCNFFYLDTCRHGNKCRFAHDYILLTEDVEELREDAMRWPCPYANRSVRCPSRGICCMAHVCPKGPRCRFAKAGRCRFVAEGMHEAAPVTVRRSDYSPPRTDSSPPLSEYSVSPLSPASSYTRRGQDLSRPSRFEARGTHGSDHYGY